MSIRYKGGILSATPPTLVAGAGASGAWTLEQQMQATAAGLWPVNGPFYIEDVFSTYLYTGTSATQTITNGINLSGNGGMVWVKARSQPTSNELYDTSRGASNRIFSDLTNAQSTNGDLNGFTSSGFSLGYVSGGANGSGTTYASWTFREQPKFFDVVTYTGTGVARTVAHSLGSVPGCIIVKSLSASTNWAVYHRGLNSGKFLLLNQTNSEGISTTYWNSTDPTSTVFTVGTNANTNTNGATYVAYLFAHDAGGFGLTGADNVISCGSLTTNASGVATVNLGYEAQWIMVKNITAAEDWWIFDVMRGFAYGSVNPLKPNLTDVEGAFFPGLYPTATGFASSGTLSPSSTYIYTAIRRGPMKTPTVGTNVFAPVVQASASPTLITTNFPVDMSWLRASRASVNQIYDLDRLRGNNKFLETTTTNAEQTYSGGWNFQSNVGVNDVAWSSSGAIWWNFQRAPGFFDEVCYTGTGSATTQTHNLGVVPEFMIVRGRSAGTAGSNWSCYHSALGNTQVISLNEGIQAYTSSQWNNTTPTASVFSVGTQTNVNGSGQTYVAYLFATVAGVSKVGSYTGTGAAQTINCGFTAGSRFVMIKRTDEVASGNPWYVWDSARGIIPANDPYLLINSTAAEVTGTDYVDTTNVGFDITSTAPASINANGGTFIFLAIA